MLCSRLPFVWASVSARNVFIAGWNLAVFAMMLAVAALPASAQTLETLHSFDSTNGSNPGSVMTIVNGKLYGTTLHGGTYDKGTIYSIGLDGSGFEVLHSFDGTAGAFPEARITEADGKLYGTTRQGGTNDLGTVFSIEPDGSGFQPLHSFATADGVSTRAPLTFVANKLFGTTYLGGSNGLGTLYSLALDGSDFDVLHNFDGYDGNRITSGLTPANGRLYGVAQEGGDSANVGAGLGAGFGAVFSIAVDGSDFQVLHSFAEDASDGGFPAGPLTLVNGMLYGTALGGGDEDGGVVFSIGPDGTGFELLHSFPLVPSGIGDIESWPSGDLAATGGLLYGTTKLTGQTNRGGIYSLGLDGSGFNVLHTFEGPDGSSPDGLIFADGVLYGTTFDGGTDNHGTIYRIAVPEPTTFALACCGLFMLLVRQLRPANRR